MKKISFSSPYLEKTFSPDLPQYSECPPEETLLEILLNHSETLSEDMFLHLQSCPHCLGIQIGLEPSEGNIIFTVCFGKNRKWTRGEAVISSAAGVQEQWESQTPFSLPNGTDKTALSIELRDSTRGQYAISLRGLDNATKRRIDIIVTLRDNRQIILYGKDNEDELLMEEKQVQKILKIELKDNS